jgi:DnaK suppressor protein
MPYETAHSLASSWLGLFAALWFASDARRIEETAQLERQEQLGRAVRSDFQPKRRNRRQAMSRSGGSPAYRDPGHRSTRRDADAQRSAKAAAESHQASLEADRSAQRVDLFPTRPGRTGSRFDSTAASPIDAPGALEDTIRALLLRLMALPELHLLGRRSALYRAQLERTLAEAISARARLADGSYGHCTVCSAPISLALLSVKPWSPVCIHCALDI